MLILITTQYRNYSIIRRGVLETRKFDTFGDWLYLKMMFLDFKMVIASLKNELPEDFIDKYWYEYEHKKLD